MFSNLSGVIWVDGEYKEWNDANIHIVNHGLHYASSVFEGLRVYDGHVFKSREHYERFHTSAKLLGFEIKYSVEELMKVTEELVKKGGYKEGYIRPLAWCGTKVMSVSHRLSNVHVAIAIWDRPVKFPDRFMNEGIRMNIAQWRRPDPRTAPVNSKAAGLYMISALSKKDSELKGFDDALMLDFKNYIAEGSSSNIFLVIDGKLYTPIPHCFLNGITRLTCIDIAKKLGIEVAETNLTMDDLAKAQEVFLCGTAIEILPVASIEGIDKIYSFKPDKITKALYKEFQKIKTVL